MNNNFKSIEAMMYIRGEIGLTPKDLKDVFNMPIFNARNTLNEFKQKFNEQEHGIFVIGFKDVFKFATREDIKENISKLVTIEKKRKLSVSAIEIAGIIAYKQPITKSQINVVRGKASENVVNTLLVKGIIEEKGISQLPGSPILYGITNKFYDYFKIQSLKELPKLSEIDESEDVEDDFDLYTSQRNDNE